MWLTFDLANLAVWALPCQFHAGCLKSRIKWRMALCDGHMKELFRAGALASLSSKQLLYTRWYLQLKMQATDSRKKCGLT